MEYIVWTEEYEGVYKPVKCGDRAAAEREIFKALKDGKEPLLTLNVPYKHTIKIEEADIGKVTKGKTEPDKGPGAESDSKVRRGDETVTKGLDSPGRDSSPGDLPGD